MTAPLDASLGAALDDSLDAPLDDGACFDVAVVGAGLAGSALALRLAAHGRHVVLLERDRFPRDKLCGEFLSTEVRELLLELGVLSEVLACEPHPIRRARLFAPPDARGRQRAPLQLDLPGTGLGLSRRTLDGVLASKAARRGVHVVTGADVRGFERTTDTRWQLDVRLRAHDRTPERRHEKHVRIRARVFVAAWGRRSRLDTRLARDFTAVRSPFVAFKHHLQPATDSAGHPCATALLDGHVELHVFDGGYCGLSLIEDGSVNACTLLALERHGGLRPKGWPDVARHLARHSPSLASRLATLAPRPDRQLQSIAQIPFDLKERARDGVLFVGDAASMLAPLAGDGQAMALESALQLADLIDHHFPLPPERAWEREWRRRYELRLHLGRALQATTLRPRAARLARAFLDVVPGLGPAIIRATRG